MQEQHTRMLTLRTHTYAHTLLQNLQYTSNVSINVMLFTQTLKHCLILPLIYYKDVMTTYTEVN